MRTRLDSPLLFLSVTLMLAGAVAALLAPDDPPPAALPAVEIDLEKEAAVVLREQPPSDDAAGGAAANAFRTLQFGNWMVIEAPDALPDELAWLPENVVLTTALTPVVTQRVDGRYEVRFARP